MSQQTATASTEITLQVENTTNQFISNRHVLLIATEPRTKMLGQHRQFLLAAMAFTVLLPASSFAFLPTRNFHKWAVATSSPNHQQIAFTTQLQLVAPTTSTTQTVAIEDLKSQVLVAIEPTKRGLSASTEKQSAIEAKIRAVETACPLTEPARDPRMGGGWEVLYTTAPPPSNGQLGPFVGVAKQKIDLQGGGYQNILQVGGGANPWLSAILDATWTEWDGTLLVEKGGGEKWRDAVVELDQDNVNVSDIDNVKSNEASSPLDNLLSMFGGRDKKAKGGNNNSKTPDYGGTSWKVDFKTISIRVFGMELFQQTFPEDTARVWKMTYLDDDTRIVRAGRTGNAKDDVVFYMFRDVTV